MKPILLLVGASASGKTTLAEDLEKQCGLKSIQSYTTRPPRYDGEKGHTFITEDEFDKLTDILAYAETNGYRYAVTKQMFEDEQYSVYVIDNTGIKYLKEHYKGDREWYVAYITAPLMQRFNRMMARQNDTEFAVSRIDHDAVEFRDVDYDIMIENADGKYSEAFASLYMFCKQIGGDIMQHEASEKPILVRWNKRTGTYEVMDNSFISDDALILDWCDSKTVIFLSHPEEEENYFTEEAFNGFIESMCECGLPNPISPSALKWLMEQDWFKNSDE